MNIRVVLTGRSYHLASEVPEQLALAEGANLDDALRAISAQLPTGEQLPPSCLVSLAGQHLGSLANHRCQPLSEGDEIVLIAPVAGG